MGKTTFVKLMTGELQPTYGAVRPHSHLRMAKFTQHFEDVLDLEQNALEWIHALYPKVFTCVEIKILRRVRAESSRRPPRHRRDACSMAWRCRFLAARRSQHGTPDALVDFHTGGRRRRPRMRVHDGREDG